MTSRRALLFTLGCLICILICCGCINPLARSSDGGGGGTGITDMTVYAKERATLGEALAALQVYEEEGLYNPEGMEITQVLGVRVDREGKARTWSIGLRNGNTTQVLEYGGGAWSGVDLQIPLPEGKIPLDQVILPDRLYEKQKDRINEALTLHGASESELTLTGEVYTVMVPSPSGTTVLTFNARTGELISSV